MRVRQACSGVDNGQFKVHCVVARFQLGSPTMQMGCGVVVPTEFSSERNHTQSYPGEKIYEKEKISTNEMLQDDEAFEWQEVRRGKN